MATRNTFVLVAAIGLVMGVMLAVTASGAPSAGGSPAAFTTVNETVDGSGHCKNGNGAVNCNIYDGKEFVWLNGGPDGANLDNGSYFFAVLEPGGQADPNDGTAANLSDPPDDGSVGDRTFTVTDGAVSYSGTHQFAAERNGLIRLFPYHDTSNPGGVYKLAICSLANGYPVNPKDCKYDSFKVQNAEVVTVEAVLSGMKYLDANANGQLDPGETGLEGWSIEIRDGATLVGTATTDASGTWSFTTSAVVLGSPTRTFTISEVQQAGYAQTGNTTDQSSVTGSVTVALANKIYTVTVPSDGSGTASGLDFGNIPLASALSAEKSATPSFTRTFKWDVTKDVDRTEAKTPDSATFTYTVTVTHDSGTDSAFAVAGNITVTNGNSAAATVSSITDSINDASASCTVTGPFPATIPASGTRGFGYACTYSAAPAASDQTNSATVSWAEQALSNATLLQAGSANASAAVHWGGPTTIIDGSASVSDPLDPSAPRTFSYTDASPSSFTYTHAYSGDPAGTCTNHDNTATLTTNTTATTDTDSERVKVCIGADLTVSKTVVPTFTRTYAWSISKSVDRTLVRALNGTATFTFTVVARETGFADSAWAATGKITLSNPNDFEAITATITDDAALGSSCTVTNGVNVSIPASSSVQLDYSCTFTSGAGATNTATATWDKTAAATPNGTKTGSAAVAFATPTTLVDETITVTDTFNGTTTTLGTLTANIGLPLVSATYTDSRTVPIPAHDCVSYTNTATFTTNDTNAIGSDSKTVTLCRIPPQTGALTMGFWQNKNGQAIITGGSSTSNVCNSGTWLRGYAPFRDLSATATCTQVATYVSNLIKVASASGASMNAMLKAQMLATALDVYFSDPALGGNRISAPSPVGARNIDLVNMCADLSCTTYVDASSAFGGATSLTVTQMLAYGASQSNAGGSVWYGNVKTAQELAKDSFDAINNQAAFQAP